MAPSAHRSEQLRRLRGWVVRRPRTQSHGGSVEMKTGPALPATLLLLCVLMPAASRHTPAVTRKSSQREKVEWKRPVHRPQQVATGRRSRSRRYSQVSLPRFSPPVASQPHPGAARAVPWPRRPSRAESASSTLRRSLGRLHRRHYLRSRAKRASPSITTHTI
jgi:hypothetical protein